MRFPSRQAITTSTHGPEPPPWWSFDDLLAYRRSRLGTHRGQYGGSYRRERLYGAPPDAAAALRGDAIGTRNPPDLPGAGLGLENALRERRVRRGHNGPLAPLSAPTTLLRRSAGRRDGTDPRGGVHLPYPAGGALGELSFLLLAARGGEGAPRLFLFDSGDGVLHELPVDRGRATTIVAEYARMGGTAADALQYAVIVLADYPAVTRKYESVAFTLVHKHVGAWMQTACLVAEDLGLSVCPLGGGRPRVVEDLLGRTAPHSLSDLVAVGELLVASREPGTKES